MKLHTQTSIFSVLLLAASMSVFAQEQEPKRIPKHTPEWTDHHGSDPGTAKTGTPAGLSSGTSTQPTESVVPELSEIVILCAHDDKNAEFEKAWSAYVEKHHLKGKKLSMAIRVVIGGATEQRSKEPGFAASEEETLAWRKSKLDYMYRAAKLVNERS